MSISRGLLFFVIVFACLSGFEAKEYGRALRRVVEGSWIDSGFAPDDHVVGVTFALKQRNMDMIKDLVVQVSDINSLLYGKYLSVEDIAKIVAPSKEVINQVVTWITSIGGENVRQTLSRDFITFQIPAAKLQSALSIKMRVFNHRASGRILVRTLDPLVLPEPISDLVELVLGLTDFFDYNSERTQMRSLRRRKSALPTSAPEFVGAIRGSEEDIIATLRIYCQDGTPAKSLSSPCAPNIAKSLHLTAVSDLETHRQTILINATNCKISDDGTLLCKLHRAVRPYLRLNVSAEVTYEDKSQSKIGYYATKFSPVPWGTPQYLAQKYNIPQGLRGSHPNNTQSVVAFEKQYISFTDLSAFFTYMGMPFDLPTVVGINDPSNPGGEATLDIQYIMGVGAGVATTFWSVSGPGPTHGNGAYILDWALQIANTTKPPLVTSISYGDTEQGFFDKFGNYDYIYRMNDELAKMALRGLTVIAGSGDAGASNVGEDGNDISDTDPTCTPMRPFFPSNSPYVLSVSSTFPSINALPICNQNYGEFPIICSQVGEVAIGVSQGTHWTTGGGFSNVTLRPTWQSYFVNKFLELSTGILPPSEYWNSSGRAYPDVSTIGQNLVVILAGEVIPIAGTSASGPILAGIIALLNDLRLHSGMPPLGLVTPLFYSLQQSEGTLFRDIVVGHNFDGDLQARDSPYPIYCPYGFTTQVGYDAVTGLGTPDYASLARVITNQAYFRRRSWQETN